jgi:hypothetical protein
MIIQQSYSHGLLYSVAPENLSSLHLNENDKPDGFNWGANESDSFMHGAINFLKLLTWHFRQNRHHPDM